MMKASKKLENTPYIFSHVMSNESFLLNFRQDINFSLNIPSILTRTSKHHIHIYRCNYRATLCKPLKEVLQTLKGSTAMKLL